jgi:rhamnose utilization protein RhaD (predicted bifunctional aldolase and dehydrogenase)
MQSRYAAADAEMMVERYAERGVPGDLALRVYTTRLIGSEPRLVLHGGGNTSVKTRLPDLMGSDTNVHARRDVHATSLKPTAAK